MIIQLYCILYVYDNSGRNSIIYLLKYIRITLFILYYLQTIILLEDVNIRSTRNKIVPENL